MRRDGDDDATAAGVQPEAVEPTASLAPSALVSDAREPRSLGAAARGWSVVRHSRRRGRIVAALAAVLLAAVAGPVAIRSAEGRPSGADRALWHPPDGLDLVGPPVLAGLGPPTRVRILAIGVDAALENLRLRPDGVLTPPVDYASPGWYADGTLPGDAGPAVIAGHVDSTTGGAVFYRLRDLREGDLVEVARGGRWLEFRVQSMAWYSKNRFPTAQVYGPTPDAQLRLITCGGDFDNARNSYRENLVVFAVAP